MEEEVVLVEEVEEVLGVEVVVLVEEVVEEVEEEVLEVVVLLALPLGEAT